MADTDDVVQDAPLQTFKRIEDFEDESRFHPMKLRDDRAYAGQPGGRPPRGRT
jgi:hypothetical protein